MTRYHDVWNAKEKKQVRFPFTPEEEAARDAEEFAAAHPAPPTLAELLRPTDAGMARVAEDVATALITSQPIPQAAKDKINARRKLRGQESI